MRTTTLFGTALLVGIVACGQAAERTESPAVVAPGAPTEEPPAASSDQSAGVTPHENGNAGKGPGVGTAPTPAVAPGVPIRACPARSGKVVALTFDDGPSPYTDRLLDILREKNAPAAFFLKGKKLDSTFQGHQGHRDRVRRIHEAGHEICNHTFSHRGLVGQTEAEMREDILKPEPLIAEITGRRTKCLRPPAGDRNEQVLRLLAELDYLVILWSMNTEDWRYASTDRPKELDPGKMLGLVQKTIHKEPGPHIHIQHDSEYSEPSVEAVPGVIDLLRAQGYTTISLSECLGAPIDEPWQG